MQGEVEHGPASASASLDRGAVLELLLESTTDYAIFVTDLTGNVTVWNRGAERLLGFDRAEAIGLRADVIFVPEDQAAGAPDEERLRALAEGRAEDERWHQRRDGSRFWGSGLLMRLPAEGDPRGFVKIVRDRTREHLAEERLRESEERFRLLAASIPQLVFSTHGDGDRIWGSPQWIEFTALSEEESRGLGWLRAVHPEDRRATLQAWRDARTTGDYYVEHRIRRASDGAWRWHQTRAKRMKQASDDDWVGTSTDIHEIRGLQERQQVFVTELQHRTRNLLAVVQAIAHQTRRSSTTVDEFEAEFQSRLTALGRVQSLLARTDEESLDLRSLVEAELAAHAGPFDTSDRVRIEGPPLRLPPVSLQAIGLALHELATNAVKYGALGQPGATLSVEWRVEPAQRREWVTLQWREEGVKMPDPEVPLHRGYGTELIERALRYQLRANTVLEFSPDGVHCVISAPLGEEVAPC